MSNVSLPPFLRLLFCTVALIFMVAKMLHATGSCETARQSCVQSTSLSAQDCCYASGSGSCRQAGESPQECVGRIVSETCDPPYQSCLSNKQIQCCVNWENYCNNVGCNGVHSCGIDANEDCQGQCNNNPC